LVLPFPSFVPVPYRKSTGPFFVDIPGQLLVWEGGYILT
jgi:hypothetical protein